LIEPTLNVEEKEEGKIREIERQREIVQLVAVQLERTNKNSHKAIVMCKLIDNRFKDRLQNDRLW